MTHEKVPDGEAEGGPENDPRLPDAGDLPTFDNVEDSFLPPLDDDLEA